jgi:hypothetical protein
MPIKLLCSQYRFTVPACVEIAPSKIYSPAPNALRVRLRFMPSLQGVKIIALGAIRTKC